VPPAIDGPFSIRDLDVLPFEQAHGNTVSYGFRFGDFAYSTDASELDEAAFAALEGVDPGWSTRRARSRTPATPTSPARWNGSTGSNRGRPT
jgi:phosphoribosyl 1,2-cyclic phosphate phosphodiesterase